MLDTKSTAARRPHILLTDDAESGMPTRVELARRWARSGPARTLWESILAAAMADLTAPPIDVHTLLPKRSAEDVRRGNREYIVVDAAGQRVVQAALAAALSGERRFAESALRQMDCLFDPSAWPEWQDIFHREKLGYDADLRTGQLARDLGLAYDWMHEHLTPAERDRVVAGIDRCGVQPYLRAVDAGAWWVERMNNWTTVIVGGLGICGMALADDHPQAAQLVAMSRATMAGYMAHYGPDGEFNENPAYANSSWQPALYFSALRYHLREADVLPQIAALRAHCYWCLYATAPPGHLVSFGDGGPGYPALTSFFPAVAAATADPILQWFYLTYGTPARSPVWELLWLDPQLEPQAPTPATLPLGRAYRAHSGLLSSRTSWDPETTPCVVFGKAGHGGVNHTHPDGGQLEVHGHGQRLLVDLGSVPYPAADARCYYHFSSDGHNQLTVGGRAQIWTSDPAHRARLTASEFDNQRGGWWRIDLTDLHEGVRRLTRTVVHLFPGWVAVVDEAQLEGEAAAVRLRWHPATDPVAVEDSAFAVTNGEARLRALVTVPGVEAPSLTLGHHEYRPPFDRDRMNNPMPQRHEPYLDAEVTGTMVRFVSLLAVLGPADGDGTWETTQSGWRFGDVDVRLDDAGLTLAGPSGAWKVPRG